MCHANFVYVDEYMCICTDLRNESLNPFCLSAMCDLYINVPCELCTLMSICVYVC